MISALRFDARAPERPRADTRRYFAEGDRVICDIGGGAYLACTVQATFGDAGFFADTLADALNRSAHLRG